MNSNNQLYHHGIKGQYKESVEELTRKYSSMSKRQLKNIGYYTYANSWFDPEAGTLQDMRSRLEKKGYNAIIDDNDKRSFIQSQAPLIVFDVMNNLGDVKINRLSDGQIRRNMVEWQRMKHSDQESRGYEDMSINTELYHHGVKGMKWGVRRYQNADGTLTNRGGRRYGGKRRELVTKKQLAVAKSMANEGRLIAENFNKLNNKSMKEKAQKNTKKLDLSGRTDAELRADINRELLERQYNQVFNSPKVDEGREIVSKILEYSGTALATTSSILGIALSVKNLKS